SETIKTYWKNLHSAEIIQLSDPEIPESIPFELTQAQKRCVTEILADIKTATPMNRVLIGDVGSGKTVVAGTAASHTIKSGKSVALVAPTKILAEQHYQTLQKIFPDLEVELLTGKTPKPRNASLKSNTVDHNSNLTPKFYVGTHALINKIDSIQPGLIIYDEQHRFGVQQRSESAKLQTIPHTLTMSATPIPRSLMLTIFSHLKVSIIDELPKGRIPTKTWVVPEEKRTGAYDWIAKELCSDSKTSKQTDTDHSDATTSDSTKLALIVCPFIDPSNHEAFENIASAKETFETIKSEFSKLGKKHKKSFTVALLHGKMKPAEQNKIIADLYDKKIDILVTTPVVEVGVDLPAASIMVIEASQRFGMASLHQLRGRVGRAGQQGYCLLFSSSNSKTAQERLENFSKETNGLKLAELDLKSRGSGDIFGTQQSGLSNLQFASWTNLELIGQAKQIYETLPKDWKPFFTPTVDPEIIKPLAN
nr:DEAD/DEAH box helicase [Candidatus Woesebacteria bacterium]